MLDGEVLGSPFQFDEVRALLLGALVQHLVDFSLLALVDDARPVCLICWNMTLRVLVEKTQHFAHVHVSCRAQQRVVI